MARREYNGTAGVLTRWSGASVATRMSVAVICGGLFGLVFSMMVAPTFAVAFTIGGALFFGAAAVILIMTRITAGSKNDDVPPTSSATQAQKR